MSIVVVRLYPSKGPMSGTEFSAALDGLTIRVADLATSAAQAQDGVPATHVAPPAPAPGPAGCARPGHWDRPARGRPRPAGGCHRGVRGRAAPPARRPEHATRDLRVEISRNGGRIAERRIFMNDES
jgi:hypothetical protein